MNSRATLAAIALVSSAFVLQPVAAQAGGPEHVRKHLHHAVHGIASVVLCPLEWFRHRHHHVHAHASAPKKVAYAKKTYAKKVAQATPLK